MDLIFGKSVEYGSEFEAFLFQQQSLQRHGVVHDPERKKMQVNDGCSLQEVWCNCMETLLGFVYFIWLCMKGSMIHG